ncbi:MAG TPA: hypothetical protein VJ103_01375, partial [Candidatus Paceibacterota bacterium]|nr:hypothetical protein [Candidatus Paceibacterota bacterium]
PAAAGGVGPLQDIIKAFRPKKEEKRAEEVAFEEKASQLDERVAVAEGGLGRLGLRSARLGTDELVELYYRTFNPGEITGQIKLG